MIGKFPNFEEHIKQYLKEPTHCIYKECNKIFLRENLEKHIKECQHRIYTCSKCWLNININEEKTYVMLICPKEEIKCPQNCGISFERCKLNEHLNSCIFSLINCPFENLGCKEKIIRKNMEEKLNQNINNHLFLLLKEYLVFKEKIINTLNLNKDEFDYSKKKLK